VVCAAATAAIRHLKTSQRERDRHQELAARVKSILNAGGLPVMPSETQIVPVMVGDPEKCKEVKDLLLAEHGIYVQPINYPIVPRGTERLRITPTPYHDDDALAGALLDVCGASWIATATPRAKRRRVKCQCEGRLLVGSSVGLSSRSKLRYLPVDQSQEPGVASCRNH
jgi:5-aminolevulinate synthase